MLQSTSPLQDPGESQEEGQSPQKQHPTGAGLVGAHCSLCLCATAVCPHAGLEDWGAAAPGTADLPLRWADGEIVTEWDGEEPVDFLAPGTMCAASLGSCSATRTPPVLSWDIAPLSWCMRCCAPSQS